jgi:outer membrane receptor protein involved in Fe transport
MYIRNLGKLSSDIFFMFDIPVKTYRSLSLNFLLTISLLFISTHIQAQQKLSSDSLTNQLLNPIIISAGRTPQAILQTAVSVTILNYVDALKLGSPSIFDALQNSAGVQMLTPSLGFRVLNTRGFTNTTNVRFSQLVDGMDNQAPHIGAPIANALGAIDLDIQQVEIISGVSSVVYGLNAINGLANIRTKNPFEFQGFSVQQLTGINRINSGSMKPGGFSQTNLRYARRLNSKLAVKFTAGNVVGNDWVADNYTDLASSINNSAGLTSSENPARDEVNGYGNESPNRRTITLNGKKYIVARTGYREPEVADYALHNFKSDAGIFIRPRSGHEISLLWKGAFIKSNYQRSNRFRLQDYQLNQFGAVYQSPYVQIRTYLTTENTGNSYNLRSLAENMDRSFKSDDLWFSDFTTSLNQAYSAGASTEAALSQARQFADEGRYMPGTPAFNEKKNELIQINNWDVGAALKVKSRLFHSEGLVSWEKLFPRIFERLGIHLLSGIDYRAYMIIPDGNYFINPVSVDRNLIYRKHGAFTQMNKSLIKNRIQLSGVIRADRSDYFKWKFNPRLTALFNWNDQTTLRAAFQSGYRFPSIFEGFSNVVSGGVKRVGGLRIMSDGIFENSYTKTSIDAFQSKVTADINTLGITQALSIENNKALLKQNPYTYLQPEFVRSFEMGFRKIMNGGKFSLDADVYLNTYKNFIAQMEASVPLSLSPDSVATFLYQKTKQIRYRLWTNSRTAINYFGGNVSLRYLLNQHVQMQGNVTTAKVLKTDNSDGLEDGFNTPSAIINLSITSDRLYKRIGGGLSARYQNSFNYLSFLVSGRVPAYFNLDTQLNYHHPKPDVYFKLGATNLLNKYYYNMLGGSSVGALYYISITFNLQ